MGDRRPEGENARVHAEAEYWDEGMVRDVRYRLAGEMRREVMEERREVLCLRESLSEQDFESVGGASGREGLRRTVPREEK